MNQENIQDIYEETNIEYISIPIKCYRVFAKIDF